MIWLLTVLLATAVPTLPTAEELEKARELFKRTKYFSALKIYSRCLKAKAPTDIPQLEDCLYEGEFAAIKTLRWLQSEIEKQRGYHSRRLDELHKMIQKMGITYQMPIDSLWYGHEFFKKLYELFPDSKHKAEVEYRIIAAEVWMMNRKDNWCRWWESWKRALEGYLKRFPEGEYSTMAIFDLANIHSDLFELRDPDYNSSYKKCFTTGSLKKDASLSKFHQKKAIQLYKQVLASPHRLGIGKSELEEVGDRIEELKKGYGDSIVYTVFD